MSLFSSLSLWSGCRFIYSIVFVLFLVFDSLVRSVYVVFFYYHLPLPARSVLPPCSLPFDSFCLPIFLHYHAYYLPDSSLSTIPFFWWISIPMCILLSLCPYTGLSTIYTIMDSYASMHA